MTHSTSKVKDKSTCCNAPVSVIHGGEGTSYWRCGTCHRPCNAIAYPSPRASQEWETAYDNLYFDRPNVRSFIATQIDLAVKAKGEEMTKIIEEAKQIRSQYPLESIVRDLLEMVAETNPGFNQRCYVLIEILDSKEKYAK